MQAVNYGFWEVWSAPQKVTFDGPNKVIIVNDGVTLIDVKEDIYSAWKGWVLSEEASNAAYPQAMRSVGGDPTVGGNYLGATFFLMNGWRLRTWEGDHRLTVEGNLYTEEGDPPFVPTVFSHNIIIEYQVSNLTSALETGGSSADVPTAQEVSTQVWADAPLFPFPPTESEIAEAIWSIPTAEHTDPITLGGTLRMLGILMRNKTVTNPDTGEMTVYSDDGTTVLFRADLFEDILGVQPYRGQGAERRERLT